MKMYYKDETFFQKFGAWPIGFFAVVIILFLFVGINVSMGIFPFGPYQTQEVTVNRLYVDYSGSGDSRSSHYMVGTNKGVFEVDNSIIEGIWNADEIYSSLQEKNTYNVTTKGNKVTGWFFQEYPHIVKVNKIEANK